MYSVYICVDLALQESTVRFFHVFVVCTKSTTFDRLPRETVFSFRR